MPGLVPGIHVFSASRCKKDVDGRDEPGHDGGNNQAQRLQISFHDISESFPHSCSNQRQFCASC
ncbi:hypothetical protein CEE89_12235 [Lactobacillus crispatus]|nr:hypothetical protein CEE89_12235 [Lactobacillus crispatus]